MSVVDRLLPFWLLPFTIIITIGPSPFESQLPAFRCLIPICISIFYSRALIYMKSVPNCELRHSSNCHSHTRSVAARQAPPPALNSRGLATRSNLGLIISYNLTHPGSFRIAYLQRGSSMVSGGKIHWIEHYKNGETLDSCEADLARIPEVVFDDRNFYSRLTVSQPIARP